MTDNEFDKSHCLGCTRKCESCTDVFDNGPVFTSPMFFGPRVDTGERFIMRYAQDRLVKELAGKCVRL